MSTYSKIAYTGLTRPQLDQAFQFFRGINGRQAHVFCYIETSATSFEIHCGSDTRQDPLADALAPLQQLQTQVAGVTVAVPTTSAQVVPLASSLVRTRYDL